MVGHRHKTLFLDTNIFVYYFASHPQFGHQVRQIFEALSQDKFRAITSVITLTELLSLSGSDKEVDTLKNHFLETPNLEIIDLNQEISIEAARIRREYKFRTPDAIQLATAINSRAEVFVTNDKKLKKFKEIKVTGLKI